MTKDEVLKLALEALETSMYPQQKQLQAITAIKEALAQPEQEYHAVNAVHKGQQCYVKTKPKEPEQEPVAFEKTVCPFCTSEWVTAEQHDRNVDRVEQEPVAFINVEHRKLEWAKYMSWDTPTVVNLPKIPLYIAPPQRKPLTDEEIGAILEDVNAYGTRLYTFARAIEAAHGIKGEA